MCKELITNPKKQMLVPIHLYIDGAVTGQFDKLQVEALKMTLGIFKKDARNKEFAWRTLGYVPNYTASESRGKKILQESLHAAAALLPTEEEEGIMDESGDDDDEASRGFKYDDDNDYELHTDKAQDYHKVLATILHSYRELEDHGMLWDYKYRGKLYKNIELVFFIQFVKCDNDEADKLTGHYRSRGRHVKQLCRHCTIKTKEADCHYFPRNTKHKTVAQIKRLVDRGDAAKLKEMSQQNIVNAFHPLQFGCHNDRGIHGGCPMEMLHHILLGVDKHVRDCFLIQIGMSSKIAPETNAIAKLLGKQFARQSERDFPSTSFSKGIFEGKIMGKEFSGVLLLIAAILQMAKGRELLTAVRKGNFKHFFQVQDWTLLVEMLLEWEEFLKLDRMELKHVNRLGRKHEFIMYLIKKITRRSQGMGLQIMKYHGILHIADDIVAHGVPSVVDTGANESHHKITKRAAILTQRNITVFACQTATRLVEFMLIDLAMSEVEGMPMWHYFLLDQVCGPQEHDLMMKEADSEHQAATGGTQIEVGEDEEGSSTWCFCHNNSRPATWDEGLVDFLHCLQQHSHVS